MRPIYGKIRVRVLAVIAILLLASIALPQTRIRFPRGRTTTVLRGSVAAGNINPYILSAREGQTMSVHLASPGNRARFELYAYRGQTLVEETTDWEDVLPVKNDYVINITTANGRAAYTLEVTIR